MSGICEFCGADLLVAKHDGQCAGRGKLPPREHYPESIEDMQKTQMEERIRQLKAELEQERAIKSDMGDLISHFQAVLGVSTEPHQTYDERMRIAIEDYADPDTKSLLVRIAEFEAEIERMRPVAEAMGPYLVAMRTKYANRWTAISERGKALDSLEAAYHNYRNKKP